VDTTFAKKIDANTWDFDLKKDGRSLATSSVSYQPTAKR